MAAVQLNRSGGVSEEVALLISLLSAAEKLDKSVRNKVSAASWSVNAVSFMHRLIELV